MTLPLDEEAFRFVVGSAHADARAYFLFEVLDEVQKTGIAIGRWVELFEPGQDYSKLKVVDQVERLVLEVIVDEQSLRIRKLVEILVALINFGQANEDDYYRHFLLLAEVERDLSQQQDTEEFYGRPSENAAFAIARARKALNSLVKEVDPTLASYAGPALSPGRFFSSTRQQLKAALAHCTDTERIVLGFSYGTFSAVSMDVHFSVRGPQ